MALVRIPLYPETLFGYYLQLSALGFGGWREPATREIVVDSQDYVRIVETALDNIINVKSGRVSVGAPLRQVCQELRSPTIYRSGVFDVTILSNAGLLGPQDRDLCTAAVTYVDKVRQSRGPLGGSCQPLALFKATVYGRARGADRRDSGSLASDSTVDSVGLGLIGALASFLGDVRVKAESHEYFLVPDGSRESLSEIVKVFEAFHGATFREKSIVDRIRDLAGIEGGLSLDVATFFSAILQAAAAVERVRGIANLVDRMMFERFILVRNVVSPTRPQIMWMSTLSISHVVRDLRLKGAVGLLESLYQLALATSRISKRTRDLKSLRQQAESVVAGCINTSLLYMWSGQPDFLVQCSRWLPALIDRALYVSGLPKDFVNSAHRALGAMERLL